MKEKKNQVNIKELAIFAMLGALMYISKLFMEFIPNVHLIGMFIVATTIVYRKKALYPLYVFVILVGLFNGFNLWWIPYLYIWLPLWAITLPVSKWVNGKVYAPIVYMIISAMHGLLFGTLYAPFQAIAFGLNFKGTIAWIIAGLPWDMVHGIGNFFAGILIIPVVKIIRICERGSHD